MGVIVIGDVPHVIINRPRRGGKLHVGDERERVVKLTLYFWRRSRVVNSPHHHRHQADLAVGDPTRLIFVVTLGDDRGLAEFAAFAHLTVSVTYDSHLTIVPATGLCETTVVHLSELEFGPVVE